MGALIKDIFRTSYYHQNIQNEKYKNFFIEKVNLFEKNNILKKVSNVGGFQTPNFRINEMDDLEKNLSQEIFINPCINFLKNFKLKRTFKLSNLHYWINKNYKNSFNMPHSHGMNAISGIYYLNVPINSGNLVFLDLNKIHDQKMMFFDDINFKEKNIIMVNNYDLILFSSEIVHYVEQNNSEETRISVAFNIHLEPI